MTHAGAHSGRLGSRLSSSILMVTWYVVMTWQELIRWKCGLEKGDAGLESGKYLWRENHAMRGGKRKVEMGEVILVFVSEMINENGGGWGKMREWGCGVSELL
ncbi:hypothetical protein VNO78_05749 [Psophocarpus tetragonolobus]|uniref:Uncharacterized protein n=1 Tax=Psophocarpus tetragonolobus TaxID=3891 RepID=A0AAN9SSB2_PSOTE